MCRSRLCRFAFCAALAFLVFCFSFLRCRRSIFCRKLRFGTATVFHKFFNMQSKRKCGKSLNAIYLRSQIARSNRDQLILFRFTPLKRQNASVFRDFPRFGFPHFGVFLRRARNVVIYSVKSSSCARNCSETRKCRESVAKRAFWKSTFATFRKPCFLQRKRRLRKVAAKKRRQTEHENEDPTQAPKRVNYVAKCASRVPRCSETQNLHHAVARARFDFANLTFQPLTSFERRQRTKAARLLPRVWRRCGACSQPPEVSDWGHSLVSPSPVSPPTRTDTTVSALPATTRRV